MGSDKGAAFSRTVTETLRHALEIRALSVADRAQLDQLIAAANAAASRYAPVLDTPVGMRAFVTHIQSLLIQAKRILAAYDD